MPFSSYVFTRACVHACVSLQWAACIIASHEVLLVVRYTAVNRLMPEAVPTRHLTSHEHRNVSVTEGKRVLLRMLLAALLQATWQTSHASYKNKSMATGSARPRPRVYRCICLAYPRGGQDLFLTRTYSSRS
jgi:hypothetical protein